MGILGKFKKDQAPAAKTTSVAKAKDAAEPKPVKTAAVAKGAYVVDQDVIVRPLITEKAAHLSEQNQYVFAVKSTANKIQVKKAIVALYNVTPIQVRVMNKRRRAVRSGRSLGMTKQWKKAIVTLKPEDKIQIYEGV